MSRRAAVSSCALALLFGCDVYDVSLLEGGGRDAAAACELAHPAERPPAGSDGPDIEPLVFAVRNAVLDQSDDAWRTIGYDLDGLCSVPPRPAVECLPPQRSAGPALDGEGGRDNQFGGFLSPVILAVRDDFVSRAQSGLTQGLGSILIRVEDWNGERDDPRVTVTFMQAVFGSADRIDEPIDEVDVSAMMLRVNGTLRDIPAWDGSDFFWVREDSFLDGDPSRPKNVDDNAYVTGGTLVLRLQSRLPFVFGGDETSVQFSLTDGIITADISEDLGTVTSLTLAGRWAILDILRTIESGGVCRGSGDYETLSRLLDLSADVRGTPGTGGPDTTCDALSIGIRFDEGKVATIVDLFPGFGIPSPCTAADGGVPDGGSGDGGVLSDAGSDAGVSDSGVDGG